MFSITRQEATIHGLHAAPPRWEYSSLAKCPLLPLTTSTSHWRWQSREGLKRGKERKKEKKRKRRRTKKRRLLIDVNAGNVKLAACRATAEAEERKLEATRVFEASRIDSRGHQLRKSSRRKEQRRAIHVTLPNCGTGVQNPLTLPYVSQLHGTKQRPVLLSSSSSSFPLSFSLLSTVPFFFFLPSRHGCRCPATVLRTKQSRKFACASTLWNATNSHPVRVQRENRATEISMHVFPARTGVRGAYTRMRRDRKPQVMRPRSS